MKKQTVTEFKVSEMIMRTAAFMAGSVQAVTSKTARVDGFGREFFGHMKTVDFGKKI